MGTCGPVGALPMGSGTDRKPLAWRRAWIMSVTASGRGLVDGSSDGAGWRGEG